MKCSEKINELLTALHTARQGFKDLEKNGENWYFKNKNGQPHMYSTIDDIFNACKDSLWENGIEVFYSTGFDGTFNILSTTLVHISSGQWMQSDTAIGDSATKPQEIGSGITYMRRYHIQAMLNLEADFEDDGNIAHGRSGDNVISPPVTPNKARTAAFDYSGPPYRVFDGNDESARFQEVRSWHRHMKSHGSPTDIKRRKVNTLNISEAKRIRSEVPQHEITEAQKTKALELIDGLGMT